LLLYKKIKQYSSLKLRRRAGRHKKQYVRYTGQRCLAEEAVPFLVQTTSEQPFDLKITQNMG
jgi:hypothetical protein